MNNLKKYLRILLIVVISIGILIVVYFAFYNNDAPKWTGFGPYDEKKEGLRGKTLWEWLDLLIIPSTIGIISWIYKEAERDKAIIEQREKDQVTNIDSFFKILTELITKNNLLKSNFDDPNRIIARTRSILAFEDADSERKGQILQFIYESGLINSNPILNLNGVNLKKSNLNGIILRASEIKGAYFNNSSMKNSFLDNSNLTSCDFSNSDFTECSLIKTNLSYTNLSNANFKDLNLLSVNFEGANLSNADLRGCQLSKMQYNTILKKEGMKINIKKLKN